MRKFFAALLTALFILSLTSCKGTPKDLSGGMFYDRYIQAEVPGEFPIGEKIPGMAEELCLVVWMPISWPKKPSTWACADRCLNP